MFSVEQEVQNLKKAEAFTKFLILPILWKVEKKREKRNFIRIRFFYQFYG